MQLERSELFSLTSQEVPIRSQVPAAALPLLSFSFLFPDTLISSLWSQYASRFMSFGSCSCSSLYVEYLALLTFFKVKSNAFPSSSLLGLP